MSASGRLEALSTGWTILLIEDDSMIGRSMDILFRLSGHGLDVADTPEKAFSLLARREYDLILLDLNFTAGRTTGEEGLVCLGRIRAEFPGTPVIVITAHSGIRIAVAAMQAGASDFLMKPWRKDDLLERCAATVRRSAQNTPAPPKLLAGSGAILGESQTISAVRALVQRVGPTLASVCVTGRSGSGRSLIAQAVHAESRASGEDPRRVDLLDFEQWTNLECRGGTVILRHPDRLDGLAQARLRERLLPDVRYISIVDGLERLTPPLRHRLATVEIAVPALAQRREDAVVLARHFAAVAGETHGRPGARLTSAAEALVAIIDWPDEVRGLEGAIERAVLLSEDGEVDVAAIRPTVAGSSSTEVMPSFGLEDAERVMIAAALKEQRHNISRTAQALGISRGTLYRRMAQHGL